MSETLINGDTAYMLICMALVNLMTPGLAFFYGGLVRSSNVLSIMAQNYASMGLMTIIWTAWGYVFLLSFLLLSCEDDDASLLSPRDYGVATNDAKTTVADISSSSSSSSSSSLSSSKKQVFVMFRRIPRRFHRQPEIALFPRKHEQ